MDKCLGGVPCAKGKFTLKTLKNDGKNYTKSEGGCPLSTGMGSLYSLPIGGCKNITD